jgi:DegV family protein with EDD domain
MDWKTRHDPEDRLTVIDTGTASGRLGVLALAVARFAAQSTDPDAVIRFAIQVIDRCEEYVFLDRLKYLATGGRLSKPRAFFGDALHLKPVIQPMATGAEKVAVVKSRQAQLDFALKKLSDIDPGRAGLSVMLEYSDNRDWITTTVQPKVESLVPDAHLLIQPFSLTSGAHMGPGTWAMAFLPDPSDENDS